ncbi:hypothetical protein QFC22_004195 [Naganishia vaughanmartiniae]|uniref:Uncharacterized protein n=1 Tax=Naganishia vaughanmartiniae TaxID=1424756 RepID=A0ACC2X2L6_9TREE|nr:hypothetical protein QFC22_004195 [Naganishia vaughanmartiniae]
MANNTPVDGPLALWLTISQENDARIAQIAGRGRGTASPQLLQPRDAIPPTDAIGRLSIDHPEIFNLVAESLIARGALQSLANLNTASYPLFEATLPLLWRTFVWDTYGKGKTKTDEYWKKIMASRGAEHIRFFVDRSNRSNSKHKNLPRMITRDLPCYKSNTLKAYISEFDDLRGHFVKHNERKVVVHLLPAYKPVGFGKGGDQDYITLRHALVHLSPPPGDKRPKKKTGNPCNPTSIGYAFYIIHPSPSQPTSALPASISEYATRHPLPVLPVTLDAILLAPAATAFTETDKPRLSHITFEFLASMDHEPRVQGVEWNGFVGEFTMKRIKEEVRCRSYLEFHWQEGEESMIICAEAVRISRHNPIYVCSYSYPSSQAAQALASFSQSKTFNWIELQFSNHTRFPPDNKAIHTILEALQGQYLIHAPRRLHPPDHNMGDVVVQDMSRDLLAALKRVVPGRRHRPTTTTTRSGPDAKEVENSGVGKREGQRDEVAGQADGIKAQLSEKGRENGGDNGKEKENDKEEGKEAEETRNVVEYFIKRYAPGEGWKTNVHKTFHDSHDPERMVFYEEFPM